MLLEVLQGLSPGRRIELAEPVVGIGRSPSNEVVLEDIVVSARHAQIVQGLDGATDVGDNVDHRPRLVDGVSIRDIAVFQAIKVPLVQNGVPVASRPVPLLVSRGGVMRVYVDVSPDFLGRALTGELVLGGQGAGAAGRAPASRYASTSRFVTRPAWPLPGMAVRSRLPSAARRRTSGVERRRRRSSSSARS